MVEEYVASRGEDTSPKWLVVVRERKHGVLHANHVLQLELVTIYFHPNNLQIITNYDLFQENLKNCALMESEEVSLVKIWTNALQGLICVKEVCFDRIQL